MEKDSIIAIAVCLAGIGGFFIGGGWAMDNSVDLISACESTLPRDQHCVLTAVPGDKP